jgi:sugar/nucleoside kinase (ribokinase family)
VVTLGAKGSFYQNGQSSEFIPGFEVDTIDATGCGDAFIAGLLSELVKGGGRLEDLTANRLRDAIRYANAVGALTALKQGVIPALPDAEQVDKFLRQQTVP